MSMTHRFQGKKDKSSEKSQIKFNNCKIDDYDSD